MSIAFRDFKQKHPEVSVLHIQKLNTNLLWTNHSEERFVFNRPYKLTYMYHAYTSGLLFCYSVISSLVSTFFTLDEAI